MEATEQVDTDLFSNRGCPICGGDSLINLFRPTARELLATNWTYGSSRFETTGLPLDDVFPIVRCGNCEFIFASRLPSLEFRRFLYDDLIGNVASRAEALSVQSAVTRMAYLSVLLRMVRTPCRLLDFGCGYGPTLSLLRNVPGVQCVGFEPSEPRAAELKASGHDVIAEAQLLLQLKPFDVVVVDNVLEHVTDPVATAKLLATLCAPSALVMVAVPEFDDIYLREQIALHRAGQAVGMDVNPWEHLSYFDATRLDTVMSKAGFTALKQSELPIDVGTGLRPNAGAFSRFTNGVASALRGIRYVATGDAVRQATMRFYRGASEVAHGADRNDQAPLVEAHPTPQIRRPEAVAAERLVDGATARDGSLWFESLLRPAPSAASDDSTARPALQATRRRVSVEKDMRPTRPDFVPLVLPRPVGMDYTARLRALTTTAPTNTYDGPPALRDSALLMSEVSARLPEGGDVLDLGCGPRDQFAPLTHLGFRYVGLDYQNPAADILGDAHAIPFVDASFDCVFSYAVLEHLHNPFVAIHEIARVLKPGGWFIGTVSQGEPFHSSFFHHTSWGILALLDACPALRIERLWSGSDTLDSLAAMGRYSRALKLAIGGLDWINRNAPWLTPRKMRWPEAEQRLDQMHRAGSLCFAVMKLPDRTECA